MAATLLSVNNYYYPRGGAEVVFFRHNGMLHDAGWSVVPFAMNHRLNVDGPERADFVSELEYGRETDDALTKIRKGLRPSTRSRRAASSLASSTAPRPICATHTTSITISRRRSWGWSTAAASRS
jgi:hypothetical protein